MAKRERFCWHCGESIGLHRPATTSATSCAGARPASAPPTNSRRAPIANTSTKSASSVTRAGGPQWEEQRVNDQQRPSALDAVRTVDAGDHVEAGNTRAVSRPVANSKAR